MEKLVLKNKKAFHDYHIIDSLEAGISLIGKEVKSIREGKMNIKESYCRYIKGELFLIQSHISQYSHVGHSGFSEYDPLRMRKLLLHKQELRKWKKKVDTQGLTIVPLKVYWRDNHVKVEIALVKGKKLHDKRNDMAKRDAKRNMARQLGNKF
ncbi:MAG: SsrA-binding protein SmpB [Candidatus Marinimicrobia bacterium]|nr:SsrA-binding protein SmpB [Candidatus Neomarinimicrobiota bacterium]